MSVCTEFWVFASCAADIPEEEARYWAKKLEQLNAMKDQDVSLQFHAPPLSQHVPPRLFAFPTSLFVFHVL